MTKSWVVPCPTCLKTRLPSFRLQPPGSLRKLGVREQHHQHHHPLRLQRFPWIGIHVRAESQSSGASGHIWPRPAQAALRSRAVRRLHGGPIEKRKAWWFSSLEYRDQNAEIQTGTRDFTTDTIGKTPLLPRPCATHCSWPSAETINSTAARTPSTCALQPQPFDRHIRKPSASPRPLPLSTAAEERQNSVNRFNSLALHRVDPPQCSAPANRPTELSFHYDNFYNDIPPDSHNALQLTDPPLGLTNELIFPDLADGANFNLPPDHAPRSVAGPRRPLHGIWQTCTCQSRRRTPALHRAHGEINVFGTGTVILTSDFGFQGI